MTATMLCRSIVSVALIHLLVLVQAEGLGNLRKEPRQGGVEATARSLNWTETEDGSPSPFEFLALSLLGSVVMVGLCYNLNRERDAIEVATLSQQEQENQHSELVEPTHQIKASESLVNKEENFHARLQETELAVRRELDNSHSSPTRVPETGLYRGSKNTVDIEVTLIFYPSSDPPGYNVQGYGKDIISETTINIGFLNEIGEMYWLEERKRAGGNFAAGENARKYTTGSYNFQSNEFQGWFESSDGLRGRCDFVLVPDVDVFREQHKAKLQNEAASRENSRYRRNSGDQSVPLYVGDAPLHGPSTSGSYSAPDLVECRQSHSLKDVDAAEGEDLNEKPDSHAFESDFSLGPATSLPLHLNATTSGDESDLVKRVVAKDNSCRSVMSWT